MKNLHLSHIRPTNGSLLPDESKLLMNRQVIDRNRACVLLFNAVPDIRVKFPVGNIVAMVEAIKEYNDEK